MPFRVQCMVFKISWCKVCLDFNHSIVGSDIGTPIWEFTWRVSKILRKVYVHEVKDVYVVCPFRRERETPCRRGRGRGRREGVSDKRKGNDALTAAAAAWPLQPSPQLSVLCSLEPSVHFSPILLIAEMFKVLRPNGRGRKGCFGLDALSAASQFCDTLESKSMP